MNLICGINPVLEALAAATRHFDRLLVVKGVRNRRIAEIVARGSQAGIPLRFEARETLDRMAGGVPHQGIIAVVSSKPLSTLDEVFSHLKTPPLLVLLDGVEDPRNLGAILRTAEAAGVDGVLIPERHSAGISESVARASAGALEHVRVARVGNVVQAIEALKEKGFWVVGFDAQGSERWDTIDFRRPIAIVMGGESRGVRRLVREKCDHVASLPLFGHVASLNVSVAAGIALYEVIRQRGVVPSHVRPIPKGATPASPKILGPSPDDPEVDPGYRPLPHPEAEEADEEGTVIRLEDEEEPAWSVQGSVPSARVQHTRAIPVGAGRDSGDRRNRRWRRRRGFQQPAPPPQGAPAPSGAPPVPSQGRRRRRRGRRRRPGAPPS